MNIQIPGWKWFPLLKGETPAERREPRGGEPRAVRRATFSLDELNLDCCIVLLLVGVLVQLIYCTNSMDLNHEGYNISHVLSTHFLLLILLAHVFYRSD